MFDSTYPSDTESFSDQELLQDFINSLEYNEPGTDSGMPDFFNSLDELNEYLFAQENEYLERFSNSLDNIDF